MTKVFRIVTTVFFLLALPIALVTTNLNIAANNMRLYEYGFNKYQASAKAIPERPKLEKAQYLSVARKLVDYFNSDEEFVQVDIYSQREIVHLKDVKGLIQLDYLLQKLSIGYILVYIA